MFTSYFQESLCGPYSKTSQGAFQPCFIVLWVEQKKQGGDFHLHFRMNERGKMQHVRNEDRCPCKAPAKSTGDKGWGINSPTFPCIAVKSQDLFSPSRAAFYTVQEFRRHGDATGKSQCCNGVSLQGRKRSRQSIRGCAWRSFTLHICILNSSLINFFTQNHSDLSIVLTCS